MNEIQPHTRELARLRVAAYCLREAAAKRGRDERARVMLSPSADPFRYWLAYFVGTAMIAARFAFAELAGLFVEVAGGALSAEQLAEAKAHGPLELPTAAAHELRTIADMAAKRSQTIHFEGVHFDPLQLYAALEGLSGDQLCGYQVIAQNGARWLHLQWSTEALIILREFTTQAAPGPDHDRPTLPPDAPANTPPSSRPSPRLYSPARAEHS